jgi:diguanylate cyclase (GGDEF)-like protein/PAS domain S-box-containing protein
MKIRTYYIVTSIALALVLLTIGVVAFKALNIQRSLVQSEEHRFRSYLLAIELFQSSEDLTRMARSYVSTGDLEYEEHYYEILDIRNGEKPRPAQYPSTYWHLSGVGKGPPIAQGEKVPLRVLMRREGIKDEELVLLQESQANSDHLVLMEKKAFAAMKGLFEDSRGNFTVHRAPDQAYAVALLFSSAYADEKAAIMAPIQVFRDVLDKRTKTELNAYENELYRYIAIDLVLILIASAVVLIRILYSFRWILRPIEYLKDRVDEIGRGNYSVRCRSAARNEVGELCGNFDNMADFLRIDIQRRKDALEMLKKSEGQVRLLLESTGEAIYGTDLEGNCTFANPTCTKMLGYDGRDILGKNMHGLMHHSHPDGRPMPPEECRIRRAILEGSGVHADDEVFWKADGTSFIAEYWSYPLKVVDKVYGAVVTFNDITERRKAEESLVAETQRLYNILEGTNLGTWEWNLQTGGLVFNERMAEIMGYRLSELSPLSIDMRSKFIHPDDLKASENLFQKHLKRESKLYECELRVRHKNGTWVWVLERGQITEWTRDGKPLLMSGIHTDITERKRSEERILYLATHDELTNLPTLRLARDRLTMAINWARRNKLFVAVVFVDLDGFKAINDNYGHDAGDEVLREVGRRLCGGVREIDTVARIGGDEFLLVLTEMQSPENTAGVVEKLIGLLSRPIKLKSLHVSVGASMGISVFPRDGENIEGLIKLADEAMYRVKNTGKNGFAFAWP